MSKSVGDSDDLGLLDAVPARRGFGGHVLSWVGHHRRPRSCPLVEDDVSEALVHPGRNSPEKATRFCEVIAMKPRIPRLRAGLPPLVRLRRRIGPGYRGFRCGPG